VTSLAAFSLALCVFVWTMAVFSRAASGFPLQHLNLVVACPMQVQLERVLFLNDSATFEFGCGMSNAGATGTCPFSQRQLALIKQSWS